MSTPYTYLIGWPQHDVFYYGVRYKAGCDPNDLFVTYFTSSKLVHACIMKFGMPSIKSIRRTFKTPKQAMIWEQKVLRRVKVLYSKRWLNQNISGAIEFNIDVRRAMSDAKKNKIWVNKHGKKTLIRRELLNTFIENGYAKGHGQLNLGDRNGMWGKKHSKETRQKISNVRSKQGCILTEQGRATKSIYMQKNNPMHNPEHKKQYDNIMSTIKRGKGVTGPGNQVFSSVREAQKNHPEIKYTTLAYYCAKKKNGWSYTVFPL